MVSFFRLGKFSPNGGQLLNQLTGPAGLPVVLLTLFLNQPRIMSHLVGMIRRPYQRT